MKKEHVITATYLLVLVGLFAVAIEMWICGSDPHCRQSNKLVAGISSAIMSNMATAQTVSITSNVPETNLGWSGPSHPNFTINFIGADSSSTSSFTYDSDGDDGDSDGH